MGTILTLSILSLLLPLQAGIMARSFGRNFWLWFFVTLPLPIISNYILLCLSDSSEIEPREKEMRSGHQSVAKRPERFSRKPIPVTVNA